MPCAIQLITNTAKSICTDLAMVTDATPAEGMRMFIGMMLQLAISEEDVELMIKTDPAKLLDLDKENKALIDRKQNGTEF